MKKLIALLLCTLCLASAVMLPACDMVAGTPSDTSVNGTSAGTAGATGETAAPVETDANGNEVYATLDGKTPAELYNAFAESLTDNFEFTQTVSTTVTSQPENSATSVNEGESTVTAKIAGTNFYMKSETPVEGGAAQVAEIWYVDGNLYVSSSDGTGNVMKMKMALSAEDANDTYLSGVVGESGPAMPMTDNLLNNVKFTKVGDAYELAITVESEDLTAMMTEMGMTADSGMQLTAMSMVITMNADGAVQSIAYSEDVVMGEISMTCEGTMTIVGIGTTEVSAPADADAYVEAPAM